MFASYDFFESILQKHLQFQTQRPLNIAYKIPYRLILSHFNVQLLHVKSISHTSQNFFDVHKDCWGRFISMELKKCTWTLVEEIVHLTDTLENIITYVLT